MNNFEKHDETQALADTHSGYELAKQVLELREENAALRKELAEAQRQLASMRGA